MNFKAFIKKVIKRIKRYMFSIKYKRLIKELRPINDEASATFALLPGIGDTVQMFAFIDSFKKENNKKIIIYCNEYLKDIVSSYNCFDKIVFYKKDSKICNDLCALTIMPKKARKLLKYNIYTSFDYYKYKKNDLNKEKYDILYQISKCIYSLDKPSIVYPLIPSQKISSIEDFDSIKDRVVIINPYSNSMNLNNKNLYESIVNYLVDNNYRVFTNVVGNQEPIKNTIPLQCSYVELYNICKSIPLIISIRSGILDYIVGSNCNMFVIYNCKRGFFDRFHLSNWKCDGKISEFFYEKNDKELLNALIELIKGI